MGDTMPEVVAETTDVRPLTASSEPSGPGPSVSILGDAVSVADLGPAAAGEHPGRFPGEHPVSFPTGVDWHNWPDPGLQYQRMVSHWNGYMHRNRLVTLELSC